MILREIIEAVPVFETIEEKEKFLIVLSALSLRLISLSKAAELMEMDKDALLNFLNTFGFRYSYLESSDIELERSW